MLRVVQSFDDAVDFREWFGRQRVVALDTETTGVDIYSPGFRVRTIQFGNTGEAWVLELDQWVGLVKELITRFDGQLLIHNAAFDIEALARHGVIVPWWKVDDTMIAMRLAEPHKPAGLKDVGTRLISAAASSGQADLHKAMRKSGWDWATVPIDFYPYIFYAAFDVVLLARVAEHRTCKAGFASPIYGLEMDVRQICTEMQRNGMRIDQSFCAAQSATLWDEANHIKARIEDVYGFNVTSNAALAKWLMAEGAIMPKTTPGGSVSVDKEALELAWTYTEPGSPVRLMIDHALRVRKIGKLASSYYDNFSSLSVDGLLHPSIETIAAKTGRMSIRNPALQTLPRASEDPDANAVRKAVIPRNDDDVLVTCDYNQIELRCIASFSKDPGLIEAFLTTDAEGGDFFTEATRMVYDDPTIVKGDYRRDGVKTLFYAASYGAGVPKMAASAKMTVDAMRDIKEKVYGRYPGIKKFMSACERVAKENDDWIVTPAGRRIWVDPEFGYKALNALIQGHAADVFKKAVRDLGHAGLSPYMVVPVHDEMLFSMPRDLVEESQPIIREVMSDLSTVVPLIAEPSPPADDWGSVVK
jgi:DNA polymerase-1